MSVFHELLKVKLRQAEMICKFIFDWIGFSCV